MPAVSPTTAPDTPDSLKAERQELENTIVCVLQFANLFDTLTDQEKSLDVANIAAFLQMTGPDMRLVIWRNVHSPEGFQWHKEAMARQKALGEQLLKDVAAYAGTLIEWEQDLETREQRQRVALSSAPLVPNGTGENAEAQRAPDNPRSLSPVLKDTGIVIGAVAGTLGDALADTLIAFGNLAGPAKALYNPFDAAFGYQDAFWKMLGFKSRPIGAQTPAQNAQLGEAFENAIFALYGPEKFPINLPEINKPGNYSTTILWGKLPIPVRPAGPGFWGPRIPQADPTVDAYELQINPNNESYYLPIPNGGYAQFENFVGDTLQDGKLLQKTPSIYDVEILPTFASKAAMEEAMRQVEAASAHGLRVQWLVSDEQAAAQLRRLFNRNRINITVDVLPPK